MKHHAYTSQAEPDPRRRGGSGPVRISNLFQHFYGLGGADFGRDRWYTELNGKSANNKMVEIIYFICICLCWYIYVLSKM